MRSSDPALVLMAHGSRDPRAAEATRALTRAVTAARPGPVVRTAYLDHAAPGPAEVLAGLAAAGHRHVVVAPLLLTAAYHSRVDLPAVLSGVAATLPDLGIHTAAVLGPDPALVTALVTLVRRLDRPADAVVLAAAGSSDPEAVATVGRVAADLGARLGVPAAAAFASASGPRVEEAVTRLRARGADRVAVAAYFLAPGRLYDRVVSGARRAGAVTVTAPLRDLPPLVGLVLDRYDRAVPALVA